MRQAGLSLGVMAGCWVPDNVCDLGKLCVYLVMLYLVVVCVK